MQVTTQLLEFDNFHLSMSFFIMQPFLYKHVNVPCQVAISVNRKESHFTIRIDNKRYGTFCRRCGIWGMVLCLLSSNTRIINIELADIEAFLLL